MHEKTPARHAGRLRPLLVAAALSFTGLAASGGGPEEAGAPASRDSRQETRVLYVGGTKTYSGEDVDAARGDDFAKFLKEQFVSVKTCRDVDFTPELASAVDVIVVDG